MRYNIMNSIQLEFTFLEKEKHKKDIHQNIQYKDGEGKIASITSYKYWNPSYPFVSNYAIVLLIIIFRDL